MALTAEQEKELKQLKTINSPVPSQKKRIRQLQQLKRTKRTVIPTGPKVVPITDKYPSGKFAGPSTKKTKEKKKPLFKLRPDRTTTAKERRDKVDASLKLKKKPINTTTKPINKRILKSTTGSVSLPKKKLKQVPTDPPKKKKIISSVRKPKLGTKTGPYKAPEPKKESTFDLLKMLRKVFSPNETISTAKIKKALPDKTTTKQIKSLQEALKPTVKAEPIVKAKSNDGRPFVRKLRSRIRQDQLAKKPIKPIEVSDELGGPIKNKTKPKVTDKGIKQRQTLSKSGKDMGKAIGEGIKQRQDKKSIDKKKVPVVKTKPIIETADQANKRIRLSNISKRDKSEIYAGAGKHKDTKDTRVSSAPGKPISKLKPKERFDIPHGSGEAGTGGISSLLQKHVDSSGGWEAYGPKSMSSKIGKLFGEDPKASNMISKAETTLYNKLLEKRNKEDPNENVLTSAEEAHMKKVESRRKGGKIGKKKKKTKQGYKSRKNESIAMRVKKKRTKKKLKASRNESYGKWGKGKGKGKVNKVFRRGGGKALRGFGNATYSNKLY